MGSDILGVFTLLRDGLGGLKRRVVRIYAVSLQTLLSECWVDWDWEIIKNVRSLSWF